MHIVYNVIIIVWIVDDMAAKLLEERFQEHNIIVRLGRPLPLQFWRWRILTRDLSSDEEDKRG